MSDTQADAMRSRLFPALTAWHRAGEVLHSTGQIARRSGVRMPRSLHPVLFSIADDSPTRTKDIARTLGILPSTASRYVAALVDIGYVRREADPDDGRAAFLVLTPAGSAAHKALVDTWTAILWEGSASRPEVDPAGLAEAFATFIDGVREISAPRSKNAEAGTVARNPPALRGARRDS